MRTHVVTREDEFLGLGKVWDGVTRASNNRSAFATWEWVYTWLRHFGGRDQLRVITVADGNDIVALVPLLRTMVGVRPFGFEMVLPIGADHSDYTCFPLGEVSRGAVDLVAERLDEIARSGVVVQLTRLEDDQLLRALRSRIDVSSRRNVVATRVATCHYLDFGSVPDVMREVARRKKNNDVPRRLRRLGEAHDVAFHHFRHADGDLERALGIVMELHRRRWDDKSGEMRGLFSDERGRAFAVEVVRALATHDQTRVSVLTADDVPIAACLGFEVSGRYHLHKTGFDPSFSKYAPKSLLIGDMLDRAADAHIEEFNFGRGETDYKLRWTNAERALTTVWLGRAGTAGRLQRSLATRTRNRQRGASGHDGPWASLPKLGPRLG